MGDAAADPLAALAAAEGYLAAQEALGERLRGGFWALAKARLRLGPASWAGPDFCREELGAARRVVSGDNNGKGAWRLVAVAEAPPTAATGDGDGRGRGRSPCPARWETWV